MFGQMSDLFDGAGAKYLSAVEVEAARSNQHEFQGTGRFRAFLGSPPGKQTFPADFHWLTDAEEALPPVRAFCTWSDVRRGRPGRSPEYHLYYAAESDPVVSRARAGDLLVIARRRDGSLLVLLAPGESTVAAQLLWLFGLDLLAGGTVARRMGAEDGSALTLAARRVLEALGLALPDPVPAAFDRLIARFGLTFPATAALSAFARETLPEADPRADPDAALLAFMEREEALFRHLERAIVAERLTQGFADHTGADVDGFLSFSLSVQNRRKSRAGYAFAHHAEAVLTAHGPAFSREATTEKRHAADFLFPGEAAYADPAFPPDRLTMLGVKTTCKDRWRQVLAEADRIADKHLLTLEPAISRAQTAEMARAGLHLVLPKALHDTYRPDQRGALLGVADFLALVRERERQAP